MIPAYLKIMEKHDKGEKLSNLEKFVLEYEPPGCHEEKQFRIMLTKVLIDAQFAILKN